MKRGANGVVALAPTGEPLFFRLLICAGADETLEFVPDSRSLTRRSLRTIGAERLRSCDFKTPPRSCSPVFADAGCALRILGRASGRHAEEEEGRGEAAA
jgi:hypothetical protein